MRHQWYGDKNDLVKWGVLLELARRHRLKHIVQVLYLTESAWGPMEIDGEQVQLPQAVLKHFRDATSVSSMQCSVPVEVVPDTMTDRSEYHQMVIERIRSRVESPGIVFLDPDTGLQPLIGRATEKHVRESELVEIWHALGCGDVLVFYQHLTNRKGSAWIEPKKLQFERALGIREGRAKLAYAPRISRDVALFFMEKGRSSDCNWTH